MWDRLIAQDGIGGEAIIWLIIAFLWVVAQLVSRAKERTRARQLAEQEPEQEQRSAPEREKTFENEMRRFLENLGSEPAEEEDDFAPETEPVRPAHRRPVQRSRTRREPSPPPIHLVERTQEAPRAETSAYIETSLGEIDATIGDEVLDTDRAYAMPESTRAEAINAFINPRTLLVNLNYIRMNMPLIPVAGLDTTNEARPRPTMHGRQQLRDAITTQLILSNPLAMGEDKASYTKRVV